MTTKPAPDPTAQIEITEAPEDEAHKRIKALADENEKLAAEKAARRARAEKTIDERFAALPDAVKATVPQDAGARAKAQAIRIFEAVRPRSAPRSSDLGPPSGLGGPQLLREEDIEAMSQRERERLFKSGDVARAQREGRFVPKSGGGRRDEGFLFTDPFTGENKRPPPRFPQDDEQHHSR